MPDRGSSDPDPARIRSPENDDMKGPMIANMGCMI